MNKKFMNALLFSAALLSSGVVATSCKDYDDDIDELRNQDATLQGDLTDKLSAVESSISSLQTAQAGLQEDITAAQNAAQAAQTAADNAQDAAEKAEQTAIAEAEAAKEAALKAQEEAIAEVLTNLDNAKAELQALIEEGVKNLQGEVDANKEGININAESIKANQEQIAAVKLDIAGIQKQIESLEAYQATSSEQIAKLDNALQELTANFTEAELSIADNAKKIGELSTAVADNTANIESAFTQIQGNAGDIATNAASIKDNAEKIAKLEAAIAAQEKTLKEYTDNQIASVQESVKTNQANIEKAQSDLAALKETVDALKYATPEEVAKVAEDIKKLNEDTLPGIISDINAINTNLEVLSTAIARGVTHVSLVVGSEYDAVEGVQNIWDNSELTLLSAKAVRSWTFGEGVVDNPVTFTEGERINRTTKFLIRVSPANATINDSDLQFIDSEGNDLIAQGIVTATIKPFEGVLAKTRSAVGTGNGLFEVAVSINNPYDEAKFTAATQLAGEKPSEPSKQRLFAVGIKDNTVKDVVRNVVSEYELTFGLPGDKTVGTLDFDVNETNITEIQNRAKFTTLVDKDAKEYVWLSYTAKDEPIFEGAKMNVQEGDNRTQKPLLNVESLKPFTIQLSDAVMETATHFYVVVDRGFLDGADDQSEEMAWDEIEPNITGINKMYDVAETGGKAEITILQDVNDVIGFRVYAVNSNGTLVDPDGRSFYVQIGNATATWSWTRTIEANVDRNEMVSDKVNVHETFSKIAANIDNATSEWDATFEGINLNGIKYGALTGDAFKLNFYDDKDNLLNPTTNASDWEKVAKVEAQFTQDAKNLIDNYTYKGVYTFRDAKKNVLYTFEISVTKTLPTAMPEAFKPKTAQPFEGGLYTCYLDWNGEAGAVMGDKDLASVFYGLKDEKSGQFDEAYTFTFADSQAGAKEGEYEDVEVVYNAVEGYNLSVGADFISDGKEHALTVGYNYGEISYRLSDDGRSYVTDEVEVENTDYAFQYVCVYDVQTWAWKKGIKNNTLTYRQAGSVTSDDIIGTSPVDKLYNASLTSIRKTFEALPADGAEVVLYGTVGNDGKTIDESVVNEYFIPEITHNNYVATINFKVNDAAQSDPGEGKTVNCIMRLTYKDKFGHDVVIELPVTIKSAIVSE